MQQLLDRFVFRIGPTTVAFVKSTDDDRLWYAHTMRQSSFRRLCVQQKTKIAWCVPGFSGQRMRESETETDGERDREREGEREREIVSERERERERGRESMRERERERERQ